MLLFSENKDERYRGAILDVFACAAKSQTQISAFLANQLEAPPKEWQGKYWIRSTINLLVKLDQVKARMIAIKALDSPDLELQVVGIQALGKCGTADDVERLKLYVRNRILVNSAHQEDELTAEAKSANSRVTVSLRHAFKPSSSSEDFPGPKLCWECRCLRSSYFV